MRCFTWNTWELGVSTALDTNGWRGKGGLGAPRSTTLMAAPLPASGEDLLADAEAAEQGVEHVFGGGAAEQAVESNAGKAQGFGDEQGIGEPGGGGEAFVGFGEEAVLALVKRGVTGTGQGSAGRGDQVLPQGGEAFPRDGGDPVAGVGLGRVIGAVGLGFDVPGAGRAFRVGPEPEDEIGAGQFAAGAVNPGLLDGIGHGPAQARRVEEQEGHSGYGDRAGDHIAGGAGDRRGDRGFGLDQGVEQGGLAGIRRPGKHDAKAFAQNFGAGAGEPFGQFGGERGKIRDEASVEPADVIVLGEIEHGFDAGRELENTDTPIVNRAGNGASGEGEGRLALKLGFSGEEIGQAFRLGQIDPAVGKGAAGEFARLGRAQAGDRGERSLHRRDHRAATVEVELGAVFPSGGAGAGEPQDQGLIEQGLVRTAQGGGDRAAGRGDLAGEGQHGAGGIGAADPDDSDGRGRSAAGQGVDRIGHAGEGSGLLARGAQIHELLEQGHAHFAHRRELLAHGLELIEAGGALHGFEHGVDIGFVGLAHIGEAEKAASLFGGTIDFDIDLHGSASLAHAGKAGTGPWQSPPDGQSCRLDRESSGEREMGEYVRIATYEGDGNFPAYVARPAGAAKAAIIVIPEIFGVNPGIRQKADHFASQGYLAVSPDVFWRQEEGIELDADVPEQLQRAFGLFGGHDFDAGIRDVEATIRWIRREAGVPKVGLVGYCMGGKVAYQAATRTDIDATVGYYGVGIADMLNESHAIARPLLLHVPMADGFVPPEQQKAMHEGLDPNPHVTIHDYPGLDHGFAAEMGLRRNEEGARLADSRTEAFFAENLA